MPQGLASEYLHDCREKFNPEGQVSAECGSSGHGFSITAQIRARTLWASALPAQEDW